jgi:hypothetical protein
MILLQNILKILYFSAVIFLEGWPSGLRRRS